jgi:hypothetical protein
VKLLGSGTKQAVTNNQEIIKEKSQARIFRPGVNVLKSLKFEK